MRSMLIFEDFILSLKRAERSWEKVHYVLFTMQRGNVLIFIN